ncbi:unnamed protein product [Ostreobium quekettii]|uniref:Protein kinase domain-containing protein n=1 Tax=Ostreobium quekettii TaxID=121088 RepID=A0A8S1JCP0_9CHLO|nr:unnamed protein product [Ostreobium quekettii]|eukprot:evm.model.scf_1504.1 EVM.evm.TU.scf_1504.1   scf_1504:10478-15671(-)
MEAVRTMKALEEAKSMAGQIQFIAAESRTYSKECHLLATQAASLQSMVVVIMGEVSKVPKASEEAKGQLEAAVVCVGAALTDTGKLVDEVSKLKLLQKFWTGGQVKERIRTLGNRLTEAQTELFLAHTTMLNSAQEELQRPRGMTGHPGASLTRSPPLRTLREARNDLQTLTSEDSFSVDDDDARAYEESQQLDATSASDIPATAFSGPLFPEEESKARELVKEISTIELAGMMYHHKLMEALQAMIKRCENCSLNMNDISLREEWRKALQQLQVKLEMVKRMIHHHRSFELDNFHRTSYVVHFLESTYDFLGGFARRWNLDCASTIERLVPASLSADVESDKQALNGCLAFIFDDSDRQTGALGDPVRGKWECLKRDYQMNKTKLAVVPESEIVLGQQIDGSASMSSGSGRVYEAQWKGMAVAVKILCQSAEMDYEDLAEFYSETFKQACLDERYVARVHGITKNGTLVMELAVDSLRNWYLNHGQSYQHVDLKKKFMAQAARALLHVHDSGIIHRDIKSMNFLVCDKGRMGLVVKIADFGLAIKQNVEGEARTGRIYGTERWMAKEVLFDHRPPSKESDVYSFGAVLYELVTNQLPFGELASRGDVYQATMKGEEPHFICAEVRKQWPPALLELMRKCCCSSLPGERPSTQEVCSYLMQQSKEVTFRYNVGMLDFLQRQIHTVHLLLRSKPVDLPDRTWKAASDVIKNMVENGNSLMRRHQVKFTMRNFYSASELRQHVEGVCRGMKRTLEDCGLHDTNIQDVIPYEVVEEDRSALRQKLQYLLNGLQCELEEVVEGEWWEAKVYHDRLIQSFQIVRDERIIWGNETLGGEYEAEYCGMKVTVNQLKPQEGELNIEEYARLFAEVTFMGSLQFPHVARLYGTSAAGFLVMERGEMTLKEWRERVNDEGLKVDWEQKGKLLYEASQGLEFVHDQGIVHRRLGSHSFWIFQNDSVKIGGFGSAIVAADSTPVSIWHQIGPYVAPEIFEGRRHDFVSDVFSFGVVIHEVCCLQQPYGEAETGLFSEKAQGLPPCSVPDDCPLLLREIMAGCCDLDPFKRPTMAEVSKRLKTFAAAALS